MITEIMIIEKHIFMVKNPGQTLSNLCWRFIQQTFIIWYLARYHAKQWKYKENRKQSSNYLFPSDRETKRICFMLFYNVYISLETNEWIIFITIAHPAPTKK